MLKKIRKISKLLFEYANKKDVGASWLRMWREKGHFTYESLWGEDKLQRGKKLVIVL